MTVFFGNVEPENSVFILKLIEKTGVKKRQVRIARANGTGQRRVGLQKDLSVVPDFIGLPVAPGNVRFFIVKQYYRLFH